jgi:hypothetical protein
MGNHHDHNDHHSNEKKPVAFTVPLIFASVIVLIIVLLVSIGDPEHGCCCEKGECSKECMEKCEKDGHPADDHKAAHMDMNAGHGHEAKTDQPAAKEQADSTAAKSEHNEEAHH